MPRDRKNLSSNFAGPSMRMNDELIARGLLAAQEKRELSESERAAIKAELDEAFDEFRDGIDLGDT